MRVPWDVKLAKNASRALDRLPSGMWQRMERAIDDLARDPHLGDVLPLKGSEWEGCLRKRVGDYRIVFSLDSSAHVVTILAVLRRSEKTYR